MNKYIVNKEYLASAERSMKFIRQTKTLSAEEERDLLIQIQQGNQVACEKLITGNLRAIALIAHNFVVPGYPLEEIINDGIVGLVEAIDNFDINSQNRFITYARWYVQRGIIKGINLFNAQVHIPNNISNMHYKILAKEEELLQLTHVHPSVEVIAKELDLPIDKIKEIKNRYPAIISLDSVSELEYYYFFFSHKNVDFESIIDQTVETNEQFYPDYRLFQNDLTTVINKILFTLTMRQSDILRKFFGIGTPEMTLEEIGVELGLTRERVHQIKEKGIRRIVNSININKDLPIVYPSPPQKNEYSAPQYKNLFPRDLSTEEIAKIMVEISSAKIIYKCEYSYINNLRIVRFSSDLQVIGESAFEGCQAIQSLDFPTSLNSILYRAFRGCSSLKEISINGAAQIFSSSAFEDCTSLKTIYIPLNLKEYYIFKFKAIGADNLIPLLKTTNKVYEGEVSIPILENKEKNIVISPAAKNVPNSRKQTNNDYNTRTKENSTSKDMVSRSTLKRWGVLTYNKIQIPMGVITIASNTFNDIKLYELVLPSSIEVIMPRTFARSVIKRIAIPRGTMEKFVKLFTGCSVNEYRIKNLVEVDYAK